ncbi:MAG TPA: hypothetical protein VF381_04340 [Thermoanaerobaculia bacterium]
MLLPAPAALVVAHPGHELRLFHWLELDRPTVFVLTDGSGRSGRSRVQSTRAVLAAIGCAEGSVMGRFTDAEVYRAIMEGDVRGVAEVTCELRGALASFRTVVFDAMELYNPAHDLCHVMASLAASPSIERYVYAVVDAPGEGITLALDDTAFERKMAMAHRYEDLSTDIDELTSKIGTDALRHEVFYRPSPTAEKKPYYEIRGEEQVRAGKYRSVLRYREHFVPFMNALAASQQPEDE